MELNFTVEEIDRLSRNGNVIFTYDAGNAVNIPTRVGDWNLHLIHQHDNKVAVVSVPSNLRTREIYTEGRMAFLKALGFNEKDAWSYIRASGPIKYRWEDSVARFVLKAIDRLDMDAWYRLHASDDHVKASQELGLLDPGWTLPRSRFLAAMQIVTAIWDLEEQEAQKAG